MVATMEGRAVPQMYVSVHQDGLEIPAHKVRRCVNGFTPCWHVTQTSMSVKLIMVDVYKSVLTMMGPMSAHVMMALRCLMTQIPVLVSITF